MATTVLILGAGFGGLELATSLCRGAPGQVDVTLIDQSDAFVFGYSKLDVMFGRRRLDEVRLPYRDLAHPGLTFRQERIVAIDPDRRAATTDGGTYQADVMVVALGADLDPGATPGLVEEGTEFYSVAGAERMAATLAEFPGGHVVIGVLGPFFKCPAAPFETAMMLHDFLATRGRRRASSLEVVSPMPKPIPVSQEASDGILGALAERDIGWRPESLVTSLDPGTKTATLRDGSTIGYDLFLAVPVHCAPPVVADSGLCVDGWVPVDPATFATAHPGVYAVGDVTSAPVPRVGVIAEGEARTVAEVLLHQILGGPEAGAYAGRATCYIEFGGTAVGKFDVDFLSGPTPTGVFTPPSVELAASKREFGSSRRQRWFGHAAAQ